MEKSSFNEQVEQARAGLNRGGGLNEMVLNPDPHQGKALLDYIVSNIMGVKSDLPESEQAYRHMNPSLMYEEPEITEAIIGGKKSLGANLTKLKRAKKLQEAGYPNTKIHEVTGWWKGRDQKWRYEIDDSSMSLKDPDKVYRNSTLGDTMEHDRLFRAYPNEKNLMTKLEVDADATTRIGTYTKGTPGDDIYFGREPEISVLAKDPKEAKTILAHETQHRVQDIEGFAGGSNLSMAMEGAPLKKELQFAKDRFDELNKIGAAHPERFTGIEASEWINLRDFVIPQLQKRMSKQAWKAYRKSPGEVEARTVEARLPMSKEVRRKSMAFDWVFDELINGRYRGKLGRHQK